VNSALCDATFTLYYGLLYFQIGLFDVMFIIWPIPCCMPTMLWQTI